MSHGVLVPGADHYPHWVKHGRHLPLPGTDHIPVPHPPCPVLSNSLVRAKQCGQHRGHLAATHEVPFVYVSLSKLLLGARPERPASFFHLLPSTFRGRFSVLGLFPGSECVNAIFLSFMKNSPLMHILRGNSSFLMLTLPILGASISFQLCFL